MKSTRPVVPADKFAYSVPAFAELVDMSPNAIRNEIKAGNLVPSYVGVKPLIPRTEAERWLASLPTERRTA